jgi:hypothetical protein
MISFQTKNSYLGKFWRALGGNILRTFGTFYEHLVHFVFLRYIFPVLVPWAKKNLATLVGMYLHNANKPLKRFNEPVVVNVS